MLKKLLFVTVLLSLALSACAAAATPQSSSRDLYSGGATGGGAAESAPMPGVVEPGLAPADVSTIAHQTGAADNRLVIKNANLSLVVTDPAAAANQITALAESLNGFVVTSNVFQASTDAAGNKIMQANIAIRLPAAQLASALEQLKAMAVTVNSETVSGEDVTAAYTDLESRLRNLEAAEAQLQKIMDGAVKTEDVLAVYNQLVAIRDQIEQVKGQMKYYRESAAMSLVNIDLQPDALSRPIEIGGWKPAGIAKDAIEALIQAFQGLATVAIWGALFCLPIGLVFGIPLYFAGRWAWRKWGKRAK